MNTNNTPYSAGLYLRLSKDDVSKVESSSIATQRKMLVNYAKENNFTVFDIYVDDGYSGTNFNRPAFKKMISDIESKNINLIITKDLSRLGRDYITSGQYTEVLFPEHNVRFIAINDCYDSDNPCNDLAPFKNIINEMYARDTSKKIRSALSTKINEGLFIGSFAPFGYKKDPLNKNHLIIDNNASITVKKIFNLALENFSPKNIADELNSLKLLTPSVYRSIYSSNSFSSDVFLKKIGLLL